MPKGGQRVNAGRKPKLRILPPVSGVVPMPADLGSTAAGYWRQWAPLAQTMGTLTPQTEPAFRLLCELQVLAQRYWAKVAEDGETFFKVTVDGSGQEQRELKAHPLIAKAAGLAYRVEQLLARFGLAPNGRPIATPSSAQPVSKWAAFGIGSSR